MTLALKNDPSESSNLLSDLSLGRSARALATATYLALGALGCSQGSKQDVETASMLTRMDSREKCTEHDEKRSWSYSPLPKSTFEGFLEPCGELIKARGSPNSEYWYRLYDKSSVYAPRTNKLQGPYIMVVSYDGRLLNPQTEKTQNLVQLSGEFISVPIERRTYNGYSLGTSFELLSSRSLQLKK